MKKDDKNNNTKFLESSKNIPQTEIVGFVAQYQCPLLKYLTSRQLQFRYGFLPIHHLQCQRRRCLSTLFSFYCS